MRLGVSNNALQQKVAVKIVTRSGMTHLDEVKKILKDKTTFELSSLTCFMIFRFRYKTKYQY